MQSRTVRLVITLSTYGLEQVARGDTPSRLCFDTFIDSDAPAGRFVLTDTLIDIPPREVALLSAKSALEKERVEMDCHYATRLANLLAIPYSGSAE